ncbi:MAG: ferrous iron transport protein A [Acidaminococcaceae bacterium]|jgi:ferrous iron transport protein A|nr:ferrous iron transport protein A [Acidaminococcaceae bacterium]MCI2109406.1 ferrous iron transport protein A [Acidaminococcaceae bacterium]
MPLFLAEQGVPQTIMRVGGTAKVRQFLENLGITIGSSIMVISTTASGLIVNIRETRVAISHEMANKIIV